MSWLSCIVSNVLLAMSMAAAAWFVQRRLRQHSVAHFLWILTLVKLVTPPLVSLPLHEMQPETACERGCCACGPHWQSTIRDWSPKILLSVWLVGIAATGSIAWRRWSRFQGLIASADPASPQWQLLAERLSAELSLRSTPMILTTPGRLPPLVVPGWGRPRILLPAELVDGLTQDQRKTLMLHELIHVKRHDHLVRILELAVRVVYWWLPMVQWIGLQLRVCEESCCDAMVVCRRPRLKRVYARLLLEVIEFISPLPPSVEHATAMNFNTRP